MKMLTQMILARCTRSAFSLAWKCTIFAIFLLLILNPNLKRAGLQLRHVANPEALIQTNFFGIEQIHRELDEWVARFPGQSEAKLVETFVYSRIQYASDYATWGNIEYWPTASEVWQRGQEDCDGRAILAVSIMRSRGFRSARLVVGLDHMWVKVNPHEKDRGAARMTALLGPNSKANHELPAQGGLGHYKQLLRLLKDPALLRKTVHGIAIEIPSLRQAALVSFLLFLCSWPGRPHWPTFSYSQSLGFGATLLFQAGHRMELPAASATSLAFLLTAILLSVLRRSKSHTSHDVL